MLTPAFSLTQTVEHVVIIVRVPFAKISEAEIDINGVEFRFYAKPYFLRLNLPGELVNSEESVIAASPDEDPVKASYDVEKGQFTIYARKKYKGEHFPDLEFISKLLAPSGASHAKPVLIEDVTNDQTAGENVDDLSERLEATELSDEEEEFDWQIEQELYQEETLSVEGPKYGFANRRFGVFRRLQAELCEAVDLKNIDKRSERERTGLRIEDEEKQFCEEHYLADLYDSESVETLIEWKPSIDSSDKLTDKDKEDMLTLPRKHYLLDSREKHSCCLCLVDLLFAYAYDMRTTEGEHTVESGWTICKLSATLSWLETWNGCSVTDVLRTSYRRALCYPLYRNWKLCEAVYNDVILILKSGRAAILSCLLDIRRILSHTEQQYILNDLYMSDLCVWIQSASDKRIKALLKQVMEVKLSKSDVGFDLENLERNASGFEDTEGQDGETKLITEIENSSDTNSDTDEEDDDDDDDDEDETDDEDDDEITENQAENNSLSVVKKTTDKDCNNDDKCHTACNNISTANIIPNADISPLCSTNLSNLHSDQIRLKQISDLTSVSSSRDGIRDNQGTDKTENSSEKTQNVDDSSDDESLSEMLSGTLIINPNQNIGSGKPLIEVIEPCEPS